jgi:hypothetical protein
MANGGPLLVLVHPAGLVTHDASGLVQDFGQRTRGVPTVEDLG